MSLHSIGLQNFNNTVLQQGLKLRPIQSHLRLNFLTLRLKYLVKSQVFSSLPFQNKRVSSHFAALFTKINKEMTIIFVSRFESSFNLKIA